MMDYQFAGYFKINTVTHLEDSRYKSEYPVEDEIVGQFYLHRSLHKNYKPMVPLSATNDPDTLNQAQEQIRQGNRNHRTRETQF